MATKKILSSLLGISKTLECAAFPNGLPEAVEASVAMQLSEPSSDSDHGAGCSCKSGTDCHCCTPRKTTRKSRRKVDINPPPTLIESPPPPLDSSQTPAHIRARIAEFRPVLPRPPNAVVDGPTHEPSTGHGHRHHGHEALYYSPYGRAYDYSHAANSLNQYPQQILPPEQELPSVDASVVPWLYGTGTDGLPFGPACGCGDNCRCPGCSQHNAADFLSPTALSSCINPGVCGNCLTCSLLAFQNPLPSESVFDYQGLDDWIRQLPNNTLSPRLDIMQMPVPKISEPIERGESFVRSGDSGTECGCPPGFCQCESEDSQMKQRLPFAVSEERASCSTFVPSVIMPIAGQGFLAVNEPLRSRSPSTSSDSSGFSSGHISGHSRQGSSSSLPMSTALISYQNVLGSRANFWSA